METPGRKIRIGEAAAAIATTPKSLRHWISRYSDKGVKPTAEQTGGWLEFSFGDVAAFAITKYLVDLGMPATEAFPVTLKIVEARWPDLFDVDNPRWTKTTDNCVMMFFLCRDGSWDFSSVHGLTGDGDTVRVPRPYETVAHIVMGVGVIVNNAFNALADMGHELPVSKKSQLTKALQQGADDEEADRITARFKAAYERELKD
jgi:hypothetical protein